MKKRNIIFSLVPTLALVVPGCVVSRDYDLPVEAADYEFLESTELVGFGDPLHLVDGWLEGEIGPVAGIEHEASVLEGYDDGSFADVQVIAQTERGDAMTWLEIVGGMEHPDLVPGFQKTFRLQDFDYDARQLQVQAVNCAGEMYNWDYDAPADEVDISVEEGSTPEILRVNFTTRIFEADPFTGTRTGGVSEAQGSFDLIR